MNFKAGQNLLVTKNKHFHIKCPTDSIILAKLKDRFKKNTNECK